jgi:hypothetical protein
MINSCKNEDAPFFIYPIFSVGSILVYNKFVFIIACTLKPDETKSMGEFGPVKNTFN